MPDYEGLYQVSDLGHVRSFYRAGCVLKPYPDNCGYLMVVLHKNKKGTTRRIHQLVAEAFLNHKPCGFEYVVNHKDLDKKNNRFDNLEITTQRENSNRKHIRSSSKFTGVAWAKGRNKWRSSIYYNGKYTHLGYFKSEEDAGETYQIALQSIRLESDFLNQNLIYHA